MGWLDVGSVLGTPSVLDFISSTTFQRLEMDFKRRVAVLFL
jgi:hypothetical protein